MAFQPPFDTLNGQLMAQAAHDYCLGRRTYMAEAGVEYLTEWWDQLENRTKCNIVRDTLVSLARGYVGLPGVWLPFAKWAFGLLDSLSQDSILRYLASRELKNLLDSDALNCTDTRF